MEPHKHLCTNKLCNYGPSIEDDYGNIRFGKAEAYCQIAEKWKEGNPSYHGLCLNCLDDERQDLEAFQMEYPRGFPD